MARFWGETGTPINGTPFKVHLWELEGIYSQWDDNLVYIKTRTWIELMVKVKRYYKIPGGTSLRSLYNE